MNKTLILIAGYPGTGKSYLCNMILEKYPDFKMLSPDTIKEMFWDRYGFKDIAEKNLLIAKAWQYYYTELEKLMNKAANIISDYPFSDKQKDTLKMLGEKYAYNIITIRMTADLEILFERQKSRDLNSSRHLGHILNSYNPEKKITDRKNAEGLLSHEEFINRCQTRGYGEFSLGKLLTIDVSDFSTADYNGLMNNLDFNINCAKMIDHTLLRTDATRKDLDKLITEAKKYNFMSVCVSPIWVKYAAQQLKDTDIKVCTVIGFPQGATPTAVKVFETKNAIENGATEVDMVIPVGLLKDKNYETVQNDIKNVVKIAKGKAVVKVIIETCLLTDEEKVTVCKIAQKAGADFVKTSTGFLTGGATVHDVKLMRETVGSNMGVKASGGIRTRKDAQNMIAAGANRIGTSNGIAIVEK